MRRLVGACVAAAFVLLSGLPAHAAGTGSIDHIENAAGSVKMLFSVPGEASSPELDSLTVTVGGAEVDATASPVAAGEVKRTTVLALDVSNSMRGERFEAAKDAALAYLAAAPQDVSVGLVTFAGEVTVVDSPTTDHGALEAAVRDLQLSAGTSLYDGVLEALVQAGSDGQRDLIVLSDGADTTSTPLDDVVSESTKDGVTVNVVALQQSPEAQATLREITDASGGVVLPADDPQALAAVFKQEADALAQQVLVEFEAPKSGEVTVTASMSAGGNTYTDSAFTTLTAAAIPAPSAKGPIPVEPPTTVIDERFLFGGTAAIGVGLAALLGLLLTRKSRDESLVERQLDFYSVSSTGRQKGSSKSARPQIDLRDSAVAVAGKIVDKAGFEERMTQRLTAAGVSLTTAEWLLLHSGLVVVGALLGFVFGNPVTVLLCVVLGAVGPWVFLGIKAGRRLKAFGGQLPETLQLMSGGLSAGLSLPQAVDTVVREGSEPMAGELRRALVEQRLGVEIEDALDGVSGRMDSKDFAWVVMAIRIQREVGGNLAELLDTVANTMREREYLRRQVKTLSAEGRLSGWILGGLPPAFAGYLSLTRPEYLEPMYTTSIGWMMIAAAGVLMTIGVFVMKIVVKVEV